MEQTNEPIIKKERKKVEKTALWRYNEDGSYNSKPIAESYFRDYYRKNATHHVNCCFCNKSVVFHDIKRHHRSKKCSIIQKSPTSDQSTSSGSENC